jgi:DNA-binding transcriptional regulator YdaS (Cro superfamily)
MNLKQYIKSFKRGSASKLANELGVSPSYLSQMASGRAPVPAKLCTVIERATNNAVRCEDLRQDVDWHYLRGTAPASTPPNQETS